MGVTIRVIRGDPDGLAAHPVAPRCSWPAPDHSAFLGIFDGHGGRGCAQAVAEFNSRRGGPDSSMGGGHCDCVPTVCPPLFAHPCLPLGVQTRRGRGRGSLAFKYNSVLQNNRFFPADFQQNSKKNITPT